MNLNVLPVAMVVGSIESMFNRREEESDPEERGRGEEWREVVVGLEVSS
jgi:hypothetical protein